MAKINMIRKSPDYGQQKITFNPKEHDCIGTQETEGIQELTQQKLDMGHSILHLGDDEFYVVYASKKTDGFTREVTDENWTRKMQLNVFERSQSKWEANVDKWFDMAMEDEDTKAEFRAVIHEAVILPARKDNKPFDFISMIEKLDPDDPNYERKAPTNAREWLKKQAITKVGTSGKRRQSPWEFMCGNGKRYGKPTAWVKKAVDIYIARNTAHKKW